MLSMQQIKTVVQPAGEVEKEESCRAYTQKMAFLVTANGTVSWWLGAQQSESMTHLTLLLLSETVLCGRLLFIVC